MVPPSQWIELHLLDEVDLTDSAVRQAAQVKRALPGLREAVAQAEAWVTAALAPVPANHPADDTWDDQIWFVRALNESQYGPKTGALAGAQRQLDDLEASEDPGRRIAGFVLARTHLHLKERGFGLWATREQSGPDVVPGLPLAELLWQARNQDQHYADVAAFHQPTLDAFELLNRVAPATFGLRTGPSTRADLGVLLKDHSWASEVLTFLGWTNSVSVIEGIGTIT